MTEKGKIDKELDRVHEGIQKVIKSIKQLPKNEQSIESSIDVEKKKQTKKKHTINLLVNEQVYIVSKRGTAL